MLELALPAKIGLSPSPGKGLVHTDCHHKTFRYACSRLVTEGYRFLAGNVAMTSVTIESAVDSGLWLGHQSVFQRGGSLPSDTIVTESTR